MYPVAKIVDHQKGHLGPSMTSRYAGQDPLSAKAAAIGAVKLPLPETGAT